ncbi:hypothetical protein [Leptolyngbya sp. FACHB-36]|nr:hypothetical protein [Leptolyngbya sp. FACHB-36]
MWDVGLDALWTAIFSVANGCDRADADSQPSVVLPAKLDSS